MSFEVALISLPIVHVRGDPFGDIPYMPTGVLYLAGFLRDNGVDLSVIDGFGTAPRQLYRIDDKLSASGLTEDEILERLGEPKLVGISVHSGMSHSFALRLAAKIRASRPDVVLIVGGHHASVVYQEFLEGAFDYVCIGEGERTMLALIRYLRDNERDLSQIPGLAYDDKPPAAQEFEQDLDSLGFAAFDLLPLENYWKLGMSHAPIRGRYIVTSTSRGCPWACRFCTTPKLLGRKWRTRSPGHIVDEIEKAVREHGIEDVIIQDEVFGVVKSKAIGIAKEIVDRALDVRLYLPSGVKVETLDEEVLGELRKAGLQYMCLAPESGSPNVLEKMNKPMDFDKLFRIVKFARRIGIRMGAFFVLGFEDESDEDRAMTRDLVVRLTRMGVDEVSLFIWTPLPGADAFESETGWTRYEDLNWSPAWRRDYAELCAFRRKLYMRWLLTKAASHPIDLARSALNVLTGKYQLKSEMALRRAIRARIPFLP